MKGEIITSPQISVPSISELPALLDGKSTADLTDRQKNLFMSIGDIFGLWVSRRKSPHIQRSYRCDVMQFVEYLNLE